MFCLLMSGSWLAQGLPFKSHFCANQVLSVVMRLGNHHFAAPTQLLPRGPDDDQVEKALVSFVDVMRESAAAPPGSEVQVSKEKFAWREFRQATKHVLAGMANALRNILPSGWSLTKAQPSSILAPRGPHADRTPLLEEEKVMVLGTAAFNARELHFYYDYKTFTTTRDFYTDEEQESLHRLVVAADEGTGETKFFLGAGFVKRLCAFDRFRLHAL